MNNDPEVVFENHEDKKKRLYRAAEYLIRYIKNISLEENKKVNVLAVSHFEILTHLVDDIFGIENVGSFNSPVFSELIKISIYETESEDKLLLRALFRDFKKDVIFNRKDRVIEQL